MAAQVTLNHFETTPTHLDCSGTDSTEIHPTKSARARGAYLRVSFKNTRETPQAINGWKLQRAVKFLENVQEHKEAVPMRRYAGGTGRAAQGTYSLDECFVQ